MSQSFKIHSVENLSKGSLQPGLQTQTMSFNPKESNKDDLIKTLKHENQNMMKLKLISDDQDDRYDHLKET